MVRFLVYILLFALPFLILPIGASQFETPKVVVAEILIETFLVLKIFQGGKIFNISRRQLLLISALLCLTIVDLIFLRTKTSFFGNPFRLQGIFLLWHLILFSALSSQIHLTNLSRKLYFIPLVLLLLTTLLLGNNPAGRAIGTLGEPNFLAATAIFFWPFIISLREGERRNKILLIIGITITAIILFLTKSHSAIIGFGLQILFIVLSKFTKIKTALIICLMLMGISLVLPFTTAREIYEDRSQIWQTAGQAIWKKPFLGYGFGNVEETVKLQSQKNSSQLQFVYVDSAHNFLLDYFLSGGIVAVGAIVGLISLAFYKFTQQKQIINIVLLMGIVAAMLFNPAGITTLLAFWWLIGQSYNSNTDN